MKPLHDRIIAIKITPEQKTATGLILVQTDADQNRDTMYAKVISVGSGKQIDSQGKIPMEVNAGDIIVCNERIPLKFPHKGIDYLVLRESDVLLVLPSNEFD